MQTCQQPLVYVRLDVIINNNPDKLFSQLQIPQVMVDPNCPQGGLATFFNELTQFVIHQLLLLVCREIHFQGHCHYGHFDLSRVLVSSYGHVRLSSDVQKELYTQEGSEVDYQRLFFIVLAFVDFTIRSTQLMPQPCFRCFVMRMSL